MLIPVNNDLRKIKAKNYAIVGFILVVIGLLFSLFQEINRDDETWFLQVVNRVLSKEVLYRDVFLGVTPLSVYLTAFFSYFFGAELIIVRLLSAIYLATTIMFSLAILKELKIISRFSITFMLSFFVFSHFQSIWGYSGYNNLARVFFIGCFFFTLKWIKAESNKRNLFCFLSSCFAALCFCSKQNVGAIAFLILLVILAVRIKQLTVRSALTELAIMFVTFGAIVIIVLLPTFLQGGGERLINYAFINKQRYLKANHCKYFMLPEQWDVYFALIFAAPFLLSLFFVLAYPVLKKEKSLETIVVFCFLAGAVLNLYPRADHPQKMIYLPFVLITWVYLLGKIPSLKEKKWWKLLAYNFNVFLIIFVFFSLALPIKGFFAKTKKISLIPHFRGIFMEKSEREHFLLIKNQFLKHYKGEIVFFLSTHCGFYFLLFDLKNPTPYDFPIHPAFGCYGEEEVLQKIKLKEIDKVYLDYKTRSNWSNMLLDRHPFKLENFIQNQMQEISFPYKPYKNSLHNYFHVFAYHP